MLASDGSRVGRVVDLVIASSDAPNVRAIVTKHRGDRWLIHWDDVVSFAREAVRLRPGVLLEPLSDPSPDSHQDAIDAHLSNLELLLVRDVLDTQVIDTAGLRVARVSEVLLTRLPDGHLSVVGVDVGTGSVLRRMGLVRWGRAVDEEVITWRDLHLTSDRGHEVQLATPTAAVHRMTAAELSHLLSRLQSTDAADVVSVLGPRRSAEAIAISSPDTGLRIVAALEADEIEPLLAASPEQAAHRLRGLIAQRRLHARRRYVRHPLRRRS